MEKEIWIELVTINDVKEFVNKATMCDFDIDIVSGRHQIDAKSLMGVLSLNLGKGKPIQLFINEIYATRKDLYMFEKWRVEIN